MMKVPPLSLVGMERLPLPLPFSPELLWRYNPLGPPTGASHHHSQAVAAAAAAAAQQQSSAPPSSQAAAVSAAAAAFTRAAAAAAAGNLTSPIQQQLPFAFDLKTTIPIRLASDPRHWNREDVSVFLQWCEREFDLPSFDMDRFQMNGKALCLLTKADLESRAPCSGDVIHNALQLLMTSGDSPLTPHTPSSVRIPQLGNGKGTWSIADLQQYAAAQQQQSTTSVTLSPAPSLDGQAGSPQDHGNGQVGQHLSSSSSSAGSGGPPSDDSEYDSVGESPERSPPIQSMSPPPSHNGNGNNHSSNGNGAHHHHHSHHHSNSSNGNSNGNANVSNGNGVANVTAKVSFSPGTNKLTNGGNGTTEPGEYNNNGRLLWDFLQQLLNDPAQRYSNFIAWKNVETGIFKIVDPPGLARLWGIQKNHLSMNYDKMSRALRYYYRVNILRKVQGERHCYQFLRNPGELKSIKNISMLRHQQNSPMSLSVKSEPMSYVNENGNGNNDYDSKYSILSHHHQQQHQQQQHNSPVSLTIKSEPVNYGNGGGNSPDDYEKKLSMLGHRQQNSPVSLTTKNSSSSPSSSTSSTSSNGAPGGGDNYGDNGDYDSNNGHPQDTPMSLTTKSASSSSSDHHHPHHQQDDPMDSSSNSSRGGHRPKPQLSPVSLSVKSEPTSASAFLHPSANNDEDYEDVPTDLSMDTDRDRQIKEED